MKLIHVAAMTRDRLIGCDGHLPWDIPSELKDFRAYTKGKTIVMGRKTYEGIGRALPHRRNILLTRNPADVQIGDLRTIFERGQYRCVGAKGEIEIYDSKQALMNAVCDDGDVLILGGAQVYQMFLDEPGSLLRISEIPGQYKGDTYFPEFEDKYREYDREKRGEFDIVWYTQNESEYPPIKQHAGSKPL